VVRQFGRFVLGALQDFSDGAFQLQIAALNDRLRIIVDLDGPDRPVSLDDPFPLRFAKANSGTLTWPPSISWPWSVMPTTPPQERLPMSGPIPAWRNIAGKMSPSDAEFSFRSATIGR